MSDDEDRSRPVRVPGPRELTATLDRPGGEACVVACPPDPRMDGRRSDSRLTAVSDALGPTACLRFDYGPWAEAEGERGDALAAVRWASERYDRVGLFGFSFGGGIALLAAPEAGPDCVSALAPASRLGGLDAAAGMDRIDCPVQVVYGERDTTAEWEPAVERARELGQEVVAMSADHFFVGQRGKVGDRVAAFLRAHLRSPE
jgi:hypothetical protein